MFLVAAPGARAQPINTAAAYVHMVDHDTGTVLMSKQADDPVVPASMAKMMTLELVFAALQGGELALDDEIFVSEHAWRTGGAPSRTATMFAEVNSNVRVEDLLRGIMVQGANDACIALAEAMAGTEEAFARRMNRRADELGLDRTVFGNATGLPNPEQTTTARDLVTLARHLIATYPDLYAVFAEPEFTWNGIRQLNRNPLYTAGIGIDGLAAGFDEDTGFGMAASAVQDGQRIVVAAHGMSSANERVAEVRRLISWSFGAFEQVEMFAARESVGRIGVYGGEPGRIEVGGAAPIRVLVPRDGSGSLRARIVYQGPLRAPVEEGAPVGVLRVTDDETVISESPLVALQPSDGAALHRRALDAAFELVIGLVHSGVEAATSR